MMRISPALVSKLGSPESKIPLAVKDAFNTAGYTYFSYDAGGSIEGKDRLIDELGTGAIWLFGIPAYKKLIDKTLYKAAKIPAEVDVRVIKDKKYLKEAVKNAPSKEIADELLLAAKTPGRTKALAIAKFALAMGLTMLSYLGLTKFKQHMTRKSIEKEFMQKMAASKNTEEENALPAAPVLNSSKMAAGAGKFRGSSVFKDFEQTSAAGSKNKPSFGSGALIAAGEKLILNPVNNMILLDLGISGSRLKNSRTDGEFKEYALKEGSFLFFVYAADRFIKKGLESFSKKFFKIPIALDAKFLASESAEKILKDKQTQQQAQEFLKTFKTGADTEGLYKFILNNQDNAVVQAAKQSGIIETIKDKAGNIKIDTRKYIDPKSITGLASDLNDFISSGRSASDIKKYLNTARGLKIAATALSIGASCLSLGYIVPKYIYQHRLKNQNGNSEFHVKAQYEKELAERNKKLSTAA